MLKHKKHVFIPLRQIFLTMLWLFKMHSGLFLLNNKTKV